LEPASRTRWPRSGYRGGSNLGPFGDLPATRRGWPGPGSAGRGLVPWQAGTRVNVFSVCTGPGESWPAHRRDHQAVVPRSPAAVGAGGNADLRAGLARLPDGLTGGLPRGPLEADDAGQWPDQDPRATRRGTWVQDVAEEYGIGAAVPPAWRTARGREPRPRPRRFLDETDPRYVNRCLDNRPHWPTGTRTKRGHHQLRLPEPHRLRAIQADWDPGPSWDKAEPASGLA